MGTQMMLRIDPESKKKLYQLARMEGKNTSQVVRELIESYIKEKDIGAYIDDLWSRISLKLRSKGMKSRDIEKAIRSVRKKRE